jgi:hypothetical protein
MTTPRRPVDDMSSTQTSRPAPAFTPTLQITVNLIVKNIKRLGFGFRNFQNYRLRLLLRCGAPWQHHRVASIRPRHPRITA